jgi:hypothetical protein
MRALQPNLDFAVGHHANVTEGGRGMPRPYNPGLHRTVRALLLAGIRLYQAFLSPVAFSACKFHPSCSRYAYEAIERHGARRGLRLALERLWRCRPFAPGGHDPVPEILEEVQ